ncbi:MAG: hypothetical protein QNK37_33485 [Acidobacteriota bacterium]|nr:hypothetical protein [Acidobacteriota bacterium]
MKQAVPLVIAVNLVAVAITLTIIFGGFNTAMDPEHVSGVGGTMTLLLILFGVAGHMKARAGQLAPAVVALAAVPGPVYAWMTGPWNHILGYHVFALGIHAFILFNLHRAEQRAGSNEPHEGSP